MHNRAYDDRARRRIARWLDGSGTTQAALAAAVGKQQPWISRYLRREFDADLGTLAKIAAAMGLTLGSLLDLAEDPAEAELLAIFRSLDAAARTVAIQALAMMRHAPAVEPDRDVAAPRPPARPLAPPSHKRKPAARHTRRVAVAAPQMAEIGKPSKRGTQKR